MLPHTMRRARLGLAIAAGVVLAAPSGAQTGPNSPRCLSMKDPVGCTCALATGGTASPTTWARGSDRAAFEACVAGRGGAVIPTKPGTIPARL